MRFNAAPRRSCTRWRSRSRIGAKIGRVSGDVRAQETQAGARDVGEKSLRSVRRNQVSCDPAGVLEKPAAREALRVAPCTTTSKTRHAETRIARGWIPAFAAHKNASGDRLEACGEAELPSDGAMRSGSAAASPRSWLMLAVRYKGSCRRWRARWWRSSASVRIYVERSNERV